MASTSTRGEEERAASASTSTPSVKEMKAAIAAAGLATADLLERADVEARYAEAQGAGGERAADLAAIRRLGETSRTGPWPSSSPRRAENAPRTTRRGRPRL